MTSADLIWRLIEILLKDKEIKSNANMNKRKISNNRRSVGTTTPTFFFCKKRTKCYHTFSSAVNLTSFD